jgi:hypothetical protein
MRVVVRCVQWDEAERWRRVGRPACPAVRTRLRPEAAMRGAGGTHALAWLSALESATR